MMMCHDVMMMPCVRFVLRFVISVVAEHRASAEKGLGLALLRASIIIVSLLQMGAKAL